MHIEVLNEYKETNGIVDEFDSVIWTTRFGGNSGDFEICTKSYNLPNSELQIGSILKFSESKDLMVVETISREYDPEDGYSYKITGVDLGTSILKRRVIMDINPISGSSKKVTEDILNQNFASPKEDYRKFQNFKYDISVLPDDDEVVVDNPSDTALKLISDICTVNECGYVMSWDKILMGYFLKIYKGQEQSEVVFASSLDNVISTIYTTNYTEYANAVLVVGDEQTQYVRPNTGISGEELIEAICSPDNDIEPEKYKHFGNVELIKRSDVDAVECELAAYIQYEYGRDYNLGDTVLIESHFGQLQSAKITEIVISAGPEGITIVPGFKII